MEYQNLFNQRESWRWRWWWRRRWWFELWHDAISLLQIMIHTIGARGNPTTCVNHQVHLDYQSIEFDGLPSESSNLTVGTPNHWISNLHSMSSKLTVGTPNLWVKRSALQIAESDGVHSKSSNLMVYSPYQSRCESKCRDSNEGASKTGQQPHQWSNQRFCIFRGYRPERECLLCQRHFAGNVMVS